MTPPTIETVIHIVESPKPEEFSTSKHEGPALQRILKLAGIKAQLHPIVNDAMFRKSIQQITDGVRLRDATVQVPVLHVSAHGSTEGILIADGTIYKWKEFGAMIAPLNKSLGGALLVFMSVCYGFSGFAMARSPDAPPFNALIGADDAISWQQTLLAFHTVYHHFFHLGSEFGVAVKAMNAAVGFDPPRFAVAYGEDVKAEFDTNVATLVQRVKELMK